MWARQSTPTIPCPAQLREIRLQTAPQFSPGGPIANVGRGVLSWVKVESRPIPAWRLAVMIWTRFPATTSLGSIESQPVTETSTGERYAPVPRA